jgi:glycosyltransferase involved in cell wall biosynthesis
MVRMAKVSVIIPAYNAANFICDTVDSALAQTHRDLEVIAVNDGSKDDTLDRLRPYGDRIRLLDLTNGGVARARNSGVNIATGEWIAFLDADDLWAPEKIARQLAHSNAPLRYTDRLNIGAYGDLPELQSLVTPMYEGDLFETLMLEGNFITTSSVLMRRDLFERMNGYFTGLNGTEDWDLWLRIAERHQIGLLPQPLISYRFHPGGISRNYVRMGRERHEVIARALALDRGRALGWGIKRRIWAQTWETNGGEARRAGARWHALQGFARSAFEWPFRGQPYKEAIKVCLNV